MSWGRVGLIVSAIWPEIKDD